MNSVFTSLLIFLFIAAVGLLAMRLRSALPEHHLSLDTKDTVKLAMGLVATMTALLLGLLVASAKGGYDAEKSAVISASAKLVLLDRMLAHYGPEAADARTSLHHAVEEMVTRLWPSVAARAVQLNPDIASGDAIYDAIQNLTPKDDAQRTLKTQAQSSTIALGEIRWLLFEQSGHAISPPLLAIVVCWLAILFGSFGLFAPANGTAIGALLVAALAVSGAILLILELDQPFDGFIQISSESMRLALSHLGK